MTRVVVLDTGSLGMIAHPKKNPAVGAWIRNLVLNGNKVVVPEIADYEVRRELLRAKMSKSVQTPRPPENYFVLSSAHHPSHDKGSRVLGGRT